MGEAISNLWEAYGPNMDTILQILAIPVMCVGLWIFGGDKIKPMWQWFKSFGKGATSSEAAFEKLMDAVDQLAHDKNFVAAADALKIAERVALPVKPVVEPANG